MDGMDKIGLRTRMWEDLFDAKKYDEFLSLYLASKRKNKVVYDIIIASISVLGAVLTFLQKEVELLKSSAFVACMLIIVVQLADKALPSWVIGDEVINKLSEYRIKYVIFYERLDRIWCEFENEKINYNEAFEKYFDLRQMNIELQQLDNSVLIKVNQKLLDLAKDRADLHMEKHFYQK